jgi:TRAP-type uncharacterized transport system fused permease subunit
MLTGSDDAATEIHASRRVAMELKHFHLARLIPVGLLMLMLMAARDFANATSAFWRMFCFVLWVCGGVMFIRLSQEKKGNRW